jgi:TM2 domain-containing membrane protein YozV
MAKNPWLAAALSFLVAGLGQMYAGYPLRGIVLVLLELGTGYMYATVNEAMGLFLNVVVGVFAIVDAYYLAKKAKANEEKPPEKLQDEPEYRVF